MVAAGTFCPVCANNSMFWANCWYYGASPSLPALVADRCWHHLVMAAAAEGACMCACACACACVSARALDALVQEKQRDHRRVDVCVCKPWLQPKADSEEGRCCHSAASSPGCSCAVGGITAASSGLSVSQARCVCMCRASHAWGRCVAPRHGTACCRMLQCAARGVLLSQLHGKPGGTAWLLCMPLQDGSCHYAGMRCWTLCVES